MTANKKLEQALSIINSLNFPKAQHNFRSGLCLLALCDMTPDKKWDQARAVCIGITPIMEWVKRYYDAEYAPNTRETFRRQSMHQFVDAGLVIYNPDDPARAVNSPNTVYQLSPEALSLIRLYGTERWKTELEKFLKRHKSLAERYAHEREKVLVPVTLSNGEQIELSPGVHSELT